MRSAKAMCCSGVNRWSRKKITPCSLNACRMSAAASASRPLDKSMPRSSAPSAPDVGRTSNRVLRIAATLIRALDLRLADHPGIFFGIRRIELGDLAEAHRLDRLQRLLRQRLSDPWTLERLDETKRDLVDDRLRGGARNRVAVPRHDIDLRVSGLAHRRHIRRAKAAGGADRKST